jgi:hypothetical protein
MNRDLLEKPFPLEHIKQRKGREGMVDYIDAPHVIQRLNEAFNGDWTFEIADDRILENEVIVRGRLTAVGITKTQFGAKDITRAKADGEIISLGDDLKAAATDCLKKCATLFGVGLHLYFAEGQGLASPKHQVDDAPAAATPRVERVELRGATPSNDTGRITGPQLSKIFSSARTLGWSQAETKEFAKSMFGKLPDFLSKREASALIDHLLAAAQGKAGVR